MSNDRIQDQKASGMKISIPTFSIKFQIKLMNPRCLNAKSRLIHQTPPRPTSFPLWHKDTHILIHIYIYIYMQKREYQCTSTILAHANYSLQITHHESCINCLTFNKQRKNLLAERGHTFLTLNLSSPLSIHSIHFFFFK